MKKYIEITDVYAREVLDSRSNPTVEVDVYTSDEKMVGQGEGRRENTGGRGVKRG